MGDMIYQGGKKFTVWVKKMYGNSWIEKEVICVIKINAYFVLIDDMGYSDLWNCLQKRIQTTTQNKRLLICVKKSLNMKTGHLIKQRLFYQRHVKLPERISRKMLKKYKLLNDGHFNFLKGVNFPITVEGSVCEKTPIGVDVPVKELKKYADTTLCESESIFFFLDTEIVPIEIKAKNKPKIKKSTLLFSLSALMLLIALVLTIVSKNYFAFMICFALIFGDNLDKAAGTLRKNGDLKK